LDGEFCIVLVTNYHVFKCEDKAEASSIVFEGKKDNVYLDKLMVKGSYIGNKEVYFTTTDKSTLLDGLAFI